MYQTSIANLLVDAGSEAGRTTFPSHRSVNSKFKRCLDIVGSLIGIVILGIVFIPIAIAIKIDSPGPILFSQERYGFQGNPFRIYKFRSMVSEAEELKSLVSNEVNGLLFKNKSDFRVTQVGRFLRKTSLDELPQFWNVLLGDMSLVGTRPPTGDEVAYYNQRHWQRLNVKPGLTGEWQVNGRSRITDFEQVVDLDLLYQKKWHPMYDLFLVLKTIYVIFAKKGAY
ncbi:sugar transferase [Calothrix rhizosoleniae]|uniref:sugar transferase n=1 Tax=Calothrix rhizosoleniae TaxID=888997 RepID=UPI000B49F988|nr:sugar transferase [Calothrix rhizosoleniae]